MKKNLLTLSAAVALLMGTQSCARCVICKDKDGDSFYKFKYCDKDYSKSDIDNEIEDAEDNGYDCTRGSMAL